MANGAFGVVSSTAIDSIRSKSMALRMDERQCPTRPPTAQRPAAVGSDG